MFRMMYRRACLRIIMQLVEFPMVHRPNLQYAKMQCGEGEILPLGFMLGKDLPLGVIADDLDVDETSQVQFL
jgi:hypothetical protein